MVERGRGLQLHPELLLGSLLQLHAGDGVESALHQRVVGRDVRPERFRDERSKAIRHRGHRGVPAKRRVRGRDVGRDVIHGSVFDVFRGSVFDVIARRFSRRLGGDERGETRETPGEIRASRAEDPRRKRSGDDGRGRERVSFGRGVRGDEGGERGDPPTRFERAEAETGGEIRGAPGRHTRASPRAPRDGARRDAAATTKKGERFELGVRGGVRELSDGPDERGDRGEERDAPRRAQFAERFRGAIFGGEFRRRDHARVTRGLSENGRVAKRSGGVERRGDVSTDAIARVGGVLGRRDVRANDGDAETCLRRERGKRETGRFRHPTRSRRQRRRDGETRRRMPIGTRRRGRMHIARCLRGRMPIARCLRGRMHIGRLSV